MTEEKKIREQVALHDYRAVTEADPPAYNSQRVNRVQRDAQAPVSLQRVVTIPEANPSQAWKTFEQRQQRWRSKRAGLQHNAVHQPVPRTFAQTGLRASSGRMNAIRHASHYTHNSPIPARSGQRRPRRGFLWKLLSMFALSVLVVLALSFALSSNAFRIAQVNVVGTHNAALVQRIQRMGLQGQNIFLLDVAGLTSRIDALPVVASADLSKQWPNQLTVTLAERVPVVLWQTAQGTYSIDDQGMIIALASETSGADRLPTVLDSSLQAGQSAQSGQTLKLRPGMYLNKADIAFAQAVLKRVPQVAGVSTFKLYYDGTMYGSNTNAVGDRSDHRVAYIVASPAGWQAYLGGADDANPLDNRLIELRQLLALAQQQQFDPATIDLRYGNRPVLTAK